MSYSRAVRVVRNYVLALNLTVCALFSTRSAHAEKVFFKDGDWELYTDGRVGGFVSYVHGNGLPNPPYVVPPGGTDGVPLHAVKGGGWALPTENHLLNNPSEGANAIDQGTVNMMRVRSGYVSNIFGFGIRDQVSPNFKVTGYMQFWAFIESINRQKNNPNFADVRQGYAMLEGRVWGSVTVGRTRTLFSRGATDIDTMYAHRWGVGFPNLVDSNGPTLGQIGFGVLGSGFASGVIYGTPTIAGFHLNAGVFDPIALTGPGVWARTSFVRPEGELTWEHSFGTVAKIVLFGNGAYQNLYKSGYCPPGNPAQPCSATASGFGYGGRFEVGPVHLGVAGHRGKGLGITYALEQSDAAQDQNGGLRKFDGYYGQLQVVVGPFDIFGGAGITRVFLNGVDKLKGPNPADPNQQVYLTSVIKDQLGINGGVVYNMTPNLHFDLDYFRAQADWYLGEQQVLNCFNGGVTFSW